MADLQIGCVVDGFVVVLGAAVVVLGVGGVVGVTQGVPGTCHWPAESEQLSTWPFGERQSLLWELSQVPRKGEASRVKPEHWASCSDQLFGHICS